MVKSSEFGGDDGLIQPVEKGHVLEPSEVLMLIHQTDPMDASAGASLPTASGS